MNAKTKKRSKVKQAKKKLKKLNRKNASSAVRTRKPYSSDMSKAAWERLKPHIPTTKIGGRPGQYVLRRSSMRCCTCYIQDVRGGLCPTIFRHGQLCMIIFGSGVKTECF